MLSLKHTMMPVVVMMLLVGCGGQATPAPDDISTAVAVALATQNAQATLDATVNFTPSPTPTPTPTLTPSPTSTSTPTPTRTRRPTRTPTLTPTLTLTPTVTPLPTTESESANSPAAAPAASPPMPTGQNLLTNPSFEEPWPDLSPPGWKRAFTGLGLDLGTNAYAGWIHSGIASLVMLPEAHRPVIAHQHVHGAVPGTTYRFGVWGKLWSSTGEDRTVSENPDPVDIWVCINTYGSQDNPWTSEGAVCSASGRPYDVWQYFYVDAVAQEELIVVSLIMVEQADNVRNMAIWDDASLTVAPAAATPTPLPVARPTRSVPSSFNANALYDAMVQARSDLEQMGGLLDRAVHDGPQPCDPYIGWYDNLVTSPVYDGVPTEWGAVYADYLWAVEHLLETSRSISDICAGGGGNLTNLEYGLGRIGINESLDRLYPAVETAAAMLGR